MIKIFVTGGTFDKSYDYKSGNLFFKKTHLPEMLKRSRCNLKVSVETLMMTDSLEMTHKQKTHIISKCKSTKQKKIIITHGTDKMASTAEALAHSNLDNKTIVLTGAMIPYAFGSSSDGFFNLGLSLIHI